MYIYVHAYDNDKIRRGEEEANTHKEENEKNQSVSVLPGTVGVRLTHSHGPSPRGEIMPPPSRIVNNFRLGSRYIYIRMYMYVYVYVYNVYASRTRIRVRLNQRRYYV